MGALAVWLALASAATPAHADTRLRVEPVQVEGTVSEIWPVRFSEHVRRGLFGAAMPTESSEGPTWIVTTQVTQRDGDYHLHLRAVSPDTDALVAEIEDVCELCGEGEVAERLQIHAAKLRAQIDAAAGMPAGLSLRSTPSGAEVEVDGEPAGVTPVELPVEPGAHRIRVELPGYEVARLSVESVSGLTITRDIELQPVVVARPPSPERAPTGRRPIHVVGIVMTGLGVAAVATGVSLMAVHERVVPNPCRPDRDGDCKYLYDTRLPGAVVLGGGAALGLTGGALWIREAVQRRRARRSRSP